MDWERIKNLIVDNKQYVIAGLAVASIFFWFKYDNGKQEETDINSLGDAQQNISAPEGSNKESGQMEREDKSKQAVKEDQEVTCDISGAVKHPDVYTLKAGARLKQLIDAAGGLTRRAHLKQVNQALILKDQDKVHIPYLGEKIKASEIVISVGGSSISESVTATNSQGESQTGNKVNINTASSQELQKLPGIGEKKAEQIVAYRQKIGQFKQIADLKQVSGIGDKTFAALKDQLAV